MTNTAKVTNININNIYNDIRLFLQSAKDKSKNTAKSYETDIKQFFSYARNKDMNTLATEDLNVKHKEVIAYRLYLKDTGLANATINRKIASLKSLYKFLNANDYPVNPNAFSLDNLSTHESSSYGILAWEEIEQMIKLVREQHKGLEKSLLIEMAVKTSIRKDALLNIKWDDIKETPGKDIYEITTTDKGQKHSKSICKEFYDRLITIKKNDRVFTLSKTTIKDMMQKLCQDMNIDKLTLTEKG